MAATRATRTPRRRATDRGGPRPGIPVKALSDDELRARIYYWPGPDATRQERINVAVRRHRARRELEKRATRERNDDATVERHGAANRQGTESARTIAANPRPQTAR